MVSEADGQLDEDGLDVAADKVGNVYVVGNGGSPATTADGGRAATQDVAHPHASAALDLWVAKLSPDGHLQWLRTFGGSAWDLVQDIAVLSDGRLALALTTNSPDFPGLAWDTDRLAEVAAQPDSARDERPAVAVLNSEGTLAWSRWIETAGGGAAWGVAAGPGGSVAVAGTAGQPSQGFAAVFTRNGTLRWLQKLSPSRAVSDADKQQGLDDEVLVYGVATDRAGRVLVTGTTGSPYLPGAQSGAQPTMIRSGHQGYVAAFRADGRGLAWASYLGGHGYSRGNDLATASDGSVTVVGTTFARDFPRVAAWQPTCAGDGSTQDGGIGGQSTGFASTLSPDGHRLLRSSCYGGAAGITRFLRVDPLRDGGLLLSGWTKDQAFPLHRQAQPFGGGYDGVVVITDRAGRIHTSTPLGGSDTDQVFGQAELPNGDVVVAGQTFSRPFPGAAPMNPEMAVVTPLFVVRAAVFVSRLNAV
jgi:hypothetical protein